MIKAIIFLNGDLSNIKGAKAIISGKDFCICADGGYLLAKKIGIKPQVVIGDDDSLGDNLKKKLLADPSVEYIHYPKDKDKTDSQLAFELASELGYRKIVVLGFFGKRFDHMMANVHAVAEILSEAEVMFVDRRIRIYIVRNHLQVPGHKGERMSLVPMKNDVEGVTTKGLRFPLSDETLYFGQTRGLSNVLTYPNVEIWVKQGVLLVFHELN